MHHSGTSFVHQSGTSGVHQSGTSGVHQSGTSDKSAQSEFKKKSTSVVSHTAAFRPPTSDLRPPTTAYSFSTSELQEDVNKCYYIMYCITFYNLSLNQWGFDVYYR